MALKINGIVGHRTDTADNYSNNNPILEKGELAFEVDTGRSKLGDGITAWNDLPYTAGGTSGGGTAGINNPLSGQKQNGIILPLYVYPSDIFNNTTWGSVFDLARTNKEVPMIIIMNPGNGAGSVVDGNWTVAIQKSKGVGIRPVGYVSTQWGGRDIALVKADIDNWISLYPDIEGIFYDEMNYDATTLDYYREVVEYANNKGLYITVGNPGGDVIKDYFDFFSIIIEWETDSGWPSAEVMQGNWTDGATTYSLYKRGLLLIGLSSWDNTTFLEALKYYGWVYITEDALDPNPWDVLSSYMTDMITAIRSQ